MIQIQKNFLTFGILFILSISLTSALAGSIGNAMMIIRAEKGDIIDKYLIIRNVNEVPVYVDLSVSEGFSDKISLLNESFILEPGEEEKAYFTINVGDSVQIEGNIYIKFSSGNQTETGVGLTSKIAVITESQVVDTITNHPSGGGSPGNTYNMYTDSTATKNNTSSTPKTTIPSVSSAISDIIENLNPGENNDSTPPEQEAEDPKFINKTLLAFCVALLIIVLIVFVINKFNREKRN